MGLVITTQLNCLIKSFDNSSIDVETETYSFNSDNFWYDSSARFFPIDDSSKKNWDDKSFIVAFMIYNSKNKNIEEL